MFLPSISVFLAAVAGWISSSHGTASEHSPSVRCAPQEPSSARVTAVSVPSLPAVTVVAATGDVGEHQLARVRTAVDAELPSLMRVFDGRPRHAFFLHVHEARESLPDSLAQHLHADSPAFALLGAHQIHLVLDEVRRTGSKLDSVVRHELVHELLDQYVAPNGRHVPRWFHEGLAQHLAGDTYLHASEDDLVLRVGTQRLRSFGELRARFPVEPAELRTAYAQSYSYVSWLVREHGLPTLLRIAADADPLTPFENVLAGRLGRTTAELEARWHDYVLHGSGAPWRVLLDQCFSLTLLVFLPVLVLALIRRLDAERRAAKRLAAADAARDAAAAAAAAEQQRLAALPVYDPPIDVIPSEEEDAEAERRAAQRAPEAAGGEGGPREPSA